MNKRGISLITGLMILLLQMQVSACGPFVTYDYLVTGGRSALNMPPATVFHELSRVLEVKDPFTGYTDSNYSDQGSKPLWKTTLDADLAELEQALGDSGDAKTILAEYKQMREAMRARAEENLEARISRNFYYPEEGAEKPATGNDYGPLAAFSPKDRPIPHPVTPQTAFDLAQYEPLLGKLPKQFSLYLRGACSFYNEDFEKAIDSFSAVLALPQEERKYRSTWAAFMLGKSRLHSDAQQALPFFEQTRQFARQGFADSLGLAEASVGWEARANAMLHRIIPALHGYATMAKSAEPSARSSALVSISWLCSALLANDAVGAIDTEGAAWAQDELSRRLLTSWFLAAGGQYMWRVKTGERDAVQAWLETVEKVNPTGEVFPDAERLAWICYQHADMEAAAKWLKMADSNLLTTQWLQSKLLLREGKFNEAEEIVQRLVDHPESKDGWEDPSADGFPERFQISDKIASELGLFSLAKCDYEKALTFFSQSGQRDDTACVAELVMNLNELEACAPRLPEDVRALCSNRLAREGFWDRAVAFLSGKDAEIARTIAACLRDGRDARQQPRQRAERLFEAGRLVFENSHLLNPWLEPNWRAGDGFKSKICRLLRNDHEIFPPTADELARVERNTAPPYHRFHYRLIASDLMWECAQLLPDNDALTAHALYLGGTYIKTRWRVEADTFYKALVRRNPNLAIAQEADKLRWFPAEFTDKVLYTKAPPPPISKRKVAKIGALCLAGVAIPGWLLFMWLKKKKRRSIDSP